MPTWGPGWPPGRCRLSWLLLVLATAWCRGGRCPGHWFAPPGLWSAFTGPPGLLPAGLTSCLALVTLEAALTAWVSGWSAANQTAAVQQPS
ncbi:hypothetical protein HaLaN_03077 [Haematococcus lacustris]|uniref:Uncharacterized protein n=1 Tax=Haematococcus lacustris TaxID=44745 RepID=A0A699YPQ7_HAELA|nr:hypothetical protein HaLaN_03077 [Haematococcus lacustris]